MAKRGPYAKGVERREQILDAALRVIAELGYRGTSVSELAAAVGLSQTGVLHYFGSKEELFIAVLRRRDEVDYVALQDENPGLGFIEVVRRNASVPGLVELFTHMAAEAADPQHPAHPYMLERYRAGTEYLATALRDMQKSGTLAPEIDAMSTATSLFALADGLQVQWLLDPTVDMAAHLERYWNQLTGRRQT
ncbi:TetR/AcrR family transcriptional regulator [Rhodococcus sp. NPDC127528]|uniref:TetR/AcrR family transcriptional regulator n=1 Tax=unclassified Rhodococcus (in: high G+C Gram-positive bacteria) TaxID=192944 RepID=UPI00362B2096